MPINDNIDFIREVNLNQYKSSVFLFGPRMTGKSYLLQRLKADLKIDLLEPDTEFTLRAQPRLFWDELRSVRKGGRVIIDEIQKVPELLGYVHKAIEQLGLSFVLSGSSARKLKRSAADMLAGRALDLRLFPLTLCEVDGRIPLEKILLFGSLPRIAALVAQQESEEAARILKAYHTVYIKEEIQSEALTRNLSAFQRFLPVVAQSNAQMIEYQNISRESSVAASTVKEYFQILEDTLIGFFLWPWNRSERKKARPKFYFFDNGVLRSIQKRVAERPTPEEMGMLFESWFVNEARRVLNYQESSAELGLWREGHHEIDLVIEKGGRILAAFEVKTGKNFSVDPSQKAFRMRFPNVPLFLVAKDLEKPRVIGNKDESIRVISAEEAVQRIRKF
ncbi:MAG: ATPase [Bdellovibrio sp.]|nr:MAG: ATPase [Bdellovibrio sp.]